MMHMVLPYPPSANRYWRTFRGRTVVSAEAKAYKKDVSLKGCIPFDGPVALTVRLYRPQKSGDLDNRLKVLCDALNGHAWHDDKQVEEIHAYRYDDKANPRVEVEVRALGAEGVLGPLRDQSKPTPAEYAVELERLMPGHVVTPEYQREQTEAVVPKKRRRP